MGGKQCWDIEVREQHQRARLRNPHPHKGLQAESVEERQYSSVCSLAVFNSANPLDRLFHVGHDIAVTELDGFWYTRRSTGMNEDGDVVQSWRHDGSIPR